MLGVGKYFRYGTLLHILCWIYCDSTVHSHYGKEFFLGMIPNYQNDHNITIDIASEAEGKVQLYVPFLNLNRTESLNKGLTTLNISQNLVKQGNFTEQRGIRINSTVSIVVFVTNFGRYETPDTYMALPSTSMGTTYIIASYQPVDGFKSEIAVVSAFPNTTLNVSDHGIVNLNTLDISQIVDVSDLTGVILSSTKPVAVISGASCAVIPVGSSDCDIVADQMLPVRSWTNIYIVPPLPPKTGSFVRVQALGALKVCFKNSTTETCRQIRRNNYLHLHLGSEPTVVHSNASSMFSVTQYGMSRSVDNVYSGPFMTVVPGLENYITKYSFVVSSVYSKFNNYLSVIIKQSDSTKLLLDGKSLDVMFTYTVSKPLDQYIVIVSNVSAGYHILNNTDETVAFGAFLYGLSDSQGYGTPLGMKYSSGDTTVPRKKHTCYHCDEMTSLEVCDVVQICSNGEVCVAEKYTARSGTFYRSGCENMAKCLKENISQSQDVCLQCCHSDYCNNKGCGDNNFPDRVDRGPMCYDCQHVMNDTNLCMKVTMCAPNEVCSIEQYRWGNDYHYKMGCTHRLCTPMKRSGLPKRIRRSTPLCSACCSEDFCNTNCTQTTDGSTGQIIVG